MEHKHFSQASQILFYESEVYSGNDHNSQNEAITKSLFCSRSPLFLTHSLKSLESLKSFSDPLAVRRGQSLLRNVGGRQTFRSHQSYAPSIDFYLSIHFSLVLLYFPSPQLAKKRKWIKVIASNITNNNGNEPYCFLMSLISLVNETLRLLRGGEGK